MLQQRGYIIKHRLQVFPKYSSHFKQLKKKLNHVIMFSVIINYLKNHLKVQFGIKCRYLLTFRAKAKIKFILSYLL